MPKYQCKCGNIIRLNEIPNPNEYKLISDDEYDEYSGLIDSDILYSRMTLVIKCNLCSRLYIFWNGYNNDPEVYLLDPK